MLQRLLVSCCALVAALASASASSSSSSSSSSSYRNAPIASPTDNPELNTNGVLINRGGLIRVPREKGWCADNALCNSTSTTSPSLTPSPSLSSSSSSSSSSGTVNEGCYSAFYFPGGYDYPHCNAGFQTLFPPSNGSPVDTSQNLTGVNAGNFNTYNISYQARLYLLDLDQNGWGPITNNGQDQQCTANFTKLCYIVMWIQNIRAGFGCRQNVDREGFQLFRGQPYFPPCRGFCADVVLNGCPAFSSAVLFGGMSASQFCELAPTSNCLSPASRLSAPLGSILAAVALALLGSSRTLLS